MFQRIQPWVYILPVVVVWSLSTVPIVGAAPRPLLYDGLLLTPSGTKSTGVWDMTVSLFDAPDDGGLLYTETFVAKSVVLGNVSLVLGATDPENLSTAFSGAFSGGTVWLQFTINGETLLPRQRVVSVPYAQVAGDSERLGGVVAAEYLQPDALGPMAFTNEYGDLDGLPAFTELDLLTKTEADDTYLSSSGGVVNGDMDLQDGLVAASDSVAGNALEDSLVVSSTTPGTAQPPVLGFTYDPTGTLSTGLVNYWSLDTSGGTLPTSIGTGSLTSFSTTVVSGKLGSARNLSGGTGSYLILNPFNSMPSSAITVSLWMKSSNTTNAGSMFSYANQTDNEFLLYNTQDFALYVTGAAAASGITLSDDQWHHVIATWRSSDGAGQFYIDGQLVFTTTLVTGASITNGGSLVLGQEQDGIGGGFDASQSYIGVLDEVAVWSRVLSAAEITALYDDGQGSFYRLTSSFGAAISLTLTEPGGAVVDGARLTAQLAPTPGETFLGFETRNSSAPLARTLRFDASGALVLKGSITLSGAPDFAENVTVADPDIGPGHVVMLTQAPGGSADNTPYDGFSVVKAALSETTDPPVAWAGVIGANPGVILHAPTDAPNGGQRSAGDQRPLVLVGRVPVNIDTGGPAIQTGDALGLSETEGLARLYAGRGPIIARALESWECAPHTQVCATTVLAMVYPGFAHVGAPSDCDPASARTALRERMRQVKSRLQELDRRVSQLASNPPNSSIP